MATELTVVADHPSPAPLRRLAAVLTLALVGLSCVAGGSSPEPVADDAGTGGSTTDTGASTAPTPGPDDEQTDADATAGGLRPMTFMAGFSPQANLPFVGVYVADARGLFADRGLEVEITHSGGGGEHLQLLSNDTVQVTTQDAAVLLERRADPGLPLVSLALVGQVGQQAWVALADSGIETPSDWAGRTVGYKGTPPPDVFAIMDAVGLDRNAVELVNVGFDPRVLTEGQVDVYPVYKSNEPDTLESWGFDLQLWDAAEFGVPTLGLAYVATADKVAADPDLLDDFVDAAMEGIAWAGQHPDEAVDIVLEWTGPEADRDHQRAMLDTELADANSAVTDQHGLGWQTAEQWEALHDLLVTEDAISAPIDVDAAYTTQFLD